MTRSFFMEGKHRYPKQSQQCHNHTAACSVGSLLLGQLVVLLTQWTEAKLNQKWVKSL